jgi:ABC-type transporter Mla subunit MlaD
MDEPRARLSWRTSLAIVVALATLAWVAIIIARTQGQWWRIHAIVREAPGLYRGALVHYAGVHVGHVEEIEFTPRGRVVLTLELSRRDIPLRLLDSVAIVRDAIPGTSSVALIGGSLAAPPVESGDTLGGSRSVEAAADERAALLELVRRAKAPAESSNKGRIGGETAAPVPAGGSVGTNRPKR